ncbi:hypothetical protein Cni_G14077 [Canna indica]|uniref:Uncharacterized protein n=1 Tax=Canna indica TaxID=4628 RepID=A0AAQ3KB19_9LILI|nr:hypothetical protein Cni_G14077 [Canna indica]
MAMEVLKIFSSLCLLSLILFFNVPQATSATSLQRRAYIVHMQLQESASLDQESFYRSFLSAVTSEQHMMYAYKNVFSGFAAKLTEPELTAMSLLPGFVRAYSDRLYKLQTTHTPSFLGLNTVGGPWNQTHFGEGIIVGLLDTGIFPDHPSFSGQEMPPPPTKWKGQCDFNASSCNNKLIGARSFIFGSTASPIDDFGHGTHTASTAAGAAVPGAQVLGNAYGVATGMAPRAHIAMYKVCDDFGCFGSDILAGMDAAVSDGVDVLSISLGGFSSSFDQDPIATGAFAAVENGVFVSCAAANAGPDPSTLSNEAPWLLTVAASTMDRNIRVTVKLGNGQTFDGESLYQPNSFTPNLYPVVYAGAAQDPYAAYCTNGSFEGFDVKGKIVVCELGEISAIEKGAVVQSAGGVGMIIVNQYNMGYTTFANAHVLPASHVSFAAGDQIKDYINSSSNPTASFLFKGTILSTTPAPAISFFSSRGPSLASPGILKPDIVGPGVNVLAAWPFPVGPPSNRTYGTTFNVISGTSMSTPHLSGIAALVKSAHLDWSPAAIKSAIMTTASVHDNTGNPIVDEQLLPADLFAVGAGFVNPMKVVDPGLVYDISPDDYVGYLCGLGYTNPQVSVIVRKPVACQTIKSIVEKDLNYPSITVALSANTTVVVPRTVKNVGDATATYYSMVSSTPGVDVHVYPPVLRFTSVNQEKKFSVVFKMMGGGSGRSAGVNVAQGYLTWVSASGKSVRSPISYYL